MCKRKQLLPLHYEITQPFAPHSYPVSQAMLAVIWGRFIGSRSLPFPIVLRHKRDKTQMRTETSCTSYVPNALIHRGLQLYSEVGKSLARPFIWTTVLIKLYKPARRFDLLTKYVPHCYVARCSQVAICPISALLTSSVNLLPNNQTLDKQLS